MVTSHRPNPGASSPGPWDLLRTSIPDLPDGLGMLDAEGRVHFLNREGARLLGFGSSPEGTPASAWRRFLKPEGGTPDLPFLRALKGDHVREEVVRLELPDHDPRWLSFSSSPLHAEGGTARGCIFRFREVSEEWQRREESKRELARRLRQRGALLQLLRKNWTTAADLRHALGEIVRISGKVLEVDRCGIWLLSDDGRRLLCTALEDRAGRKAEEEPDLEASQHPAYLAAVSEKETMPIEDVGTDARMRELRAKYISPRGIGAMLDAPLYLEGRLRGVICHEHVGGPRVWKDDERTFSVAVAAVASRAFGDWERRRVGETLQEHERKIEALEESRDRDTRFSKLATNAGSMSDVIRRLRLAAKSDVTLLLRGESGTGKELAARAVHAHSSRAQRPFEAVNCAALPPTILESELFGHVKGAFTDASRDHPGLFRQAHKGTLFLDEIGELPPALQAKVLRVLQDREVRPVGGDTPVKVDVRIIAATNRNLEEDLAAGRLREDFYYRIRVFEVVLPPLRDRLEDLPMLVDRILKELATATGRRVPGLDPAAMRKLEGYRWPGNVRELRNALEHALVTAQGDRIRVPDLPPLTATRRPGPPAAPRDPAEAERILEALRTERGHRSRAAKRLGISRVTLWHRMKALGLDSGR
jgi:transcriptional regulator with GAF, ATPase, and Fis domain